MQLQFCKRCVISNFRPNSVPEHLNCGQAKTYIHFDEEGVCDACRVTERKKCIDWTLRRKELEVLCEEHRSSTGSYDCIVPGSGGKDSFYAVHRLRHDFGMHPLTVTWAPHIYTEWGRRNFDRWCGVADNLCCTPNRNTHRLLTRLAVENLFHPFQPFMLGQKSLAPRMAVLHNIPLVFYGENEAEYGNPKGDADVSRRDDSYYSGDALFLGGASIADLRGRYGLSQADLSPYLPLSKAAAKFVDVRYLGYYLKWHPQSNYYYAVEHGGFEAAPERTPGTYSKYSSIDDKIDDLHYYTTWVKFGIGRATYDAAQEIRSGDITRDEGVSLVRRFDGEFPERFFGECCDYLSVDGLPAMTRERFMMLADKFKSDQVHAGRVWDCESA